MNAQESPSSDHPSADGRGGGDAYDITSRSLPELERHVRETADSTASPGHWEQVRDLAVGRMQRNSDAAETRIRWRHLALSALPKKHSGNTDPKVELAEEVSIRAYMIRFFGASETDATRQPSDLCAAIFPQIGMTPAEVTQSAEAWQTKPREEILQLRRIKNVLSPLLQIKDVLSRDEKVAPDIHEWLALIPQLP
ncbi:hypothetical protein ACGF1Z_21615 [Streptomyces sp. NPDC048018]|uniref:hypothetical protein n=1 Tax=Streptomyces sp. NPDC048018 TaxID=3365499 RepID=UPI00371F969B